jgi:hypothetical protein
MPLGPSYLGRGKLNYIFGSKCIIRTKESNILPNYWDLIDGKARQDDLWRKRGTWPSAVGKRIH